MTITPTKTLRLPNVRAEQLEMIRKARGLASLAETVGYLINCEIAKGTISEVVPGVIVETFGPRVLKVMLGELRFAFDAGQTREFAAAIRKATQKGAPRYFQPSFEVNRRGSGVVITSESGAQHAMSFDVAADVADQIERALDEAQNPTDE